MPAKDYWPCVLQSLKKTIPNSNYKAWCSSLKFLHTTNRGHKLLIEVPSAFHKRYLETKLKKEITESISKYYPQVIHIEYQVSKKQNILEQEIQQKYTQQEINYQKRVDANPTKSQTPDHISNSLKASKSSRVSYLFNNLNNLNSKYNFENFVVTSNNELATNVVQSVVDQPGKLYNPIFIYSRVGLGKTHLLQAAGQKFLETNPSKNIKYIPSETFISQYILSIQKKTVSDFRKYYADIDLLLIDDIQFIAGKESTQQVFFHIFNELKQNNKQIIITSDKQPSVLEGIEERLTSRFSWGMVVDISKPNLEDRLAILKDKLKRTNITLTQQQALNIATSLDTNIRDMEGFINKLQAITKFRGQTSIPDEDLDKIMYRPTKDSQDTGTNTQDQPSILNAEAVINTVSKLMDVSKKEVFSSNRQKEVVLARSIIIWYLRGKLNLSYTRIGTLTKIHHTTAIHSYKKIQEQKNKDTNLKNIIQAIDKSLAKYTL